MDIKKRTEQTVARNYKPINYKEKKECIWCGDKAIEDYYKMLDNKKPPGLTERQ